MKKAIRFACLCLLFPAVLLAQKTGIMAGTAKVNLTPKTDEPIHDSIYARSLVLEGNGVRIAFVAVDLPFLQALVWRRSAGKNSASTG